MPITFWLIGEPSPINPVGVRHVPRHQCQQCHRRRHNPEAYVRRTLVNSTINWRQRLLARERTVAVVPDAAVADFTVEHAARDETWRALARLPRRQRAVLVLRYYEDLTEAQAAALLGCSVGTIKSQTAKALGRLRADAALFGADAQPDNNPATTTG